MIFSNSTMPLAFILFPLLILVLLRLDLGWAALATLFVAAIASWYTVHHLGPFSSFIARSPIEPAVFLQIFIAVAIFTLYSVSVVLENLRTAERRLQEIATLHQLVTDNSRDIIMLADFDGMPRYISPAVGLLTGYNPRETMHRGFADVIHPDDLPRMAALVQALRAGSETGTLEYRVKKRNGEHVWVEGSLHILRDSRTAVRTGILQIVRDITDRKLAEEARQLQHSLIDAINEVSLDGILVVDDRQNVVSCNRRFAEVWQLDLQESVPGHLDSAARLSERQLLSQALTRLKDRNAFENRLKELYANPDEKDHCEVELVDGRTLERYSTCVRTKDGQYRGRVWFFRDITDDKLSQQKLTEAYHAVEVLADTDALTGLANRRRFDQCFATEWRRGLRDRHPLSLLLIDADFFKSYNDTFGHLRGDNCLQQIATAVQAVVARPGDLVTRFGGEEFAVILPNTANSGALQMARDICTAVSNRHFLTLPTPLAWSPFPPDASPSCPSWESKRLLSSTAPIRLSTRPSAPAAIAPVTTSRPMRLTIQQNLVLLRSQSSQLERQYRLKI